MNIFMKRKTPAQRSVKEEKYEPESKHEWSQKLECSMSDLELGKTLGTGTFGRVRLAQHSDVDGKYFALKILKKKEVIRLKQVSHILSECDILSTVSHPFIVNLVAKFQDPVKLYMLLEYVPGGEMFSHLRKTVRFPANQAKLYTAEIILAFEHLHKRHIAYRDLKPENLLITDTGHMKIADFGFAKKIVKCTWTLCGTPEYLAPEIIKSKGHGVGVDWWALGVLIFEMLAGYPPFYEENVFGIYKKILKSTVAYPASFDSRAKELVKKLLVADLTKRIGCLRNGADDIKKQKWFDKMDWEAVYMRKTTPMFVPKVKSAGDTSNFDDYPDSVERSMVITPKENNLFRDFGVVE